MIGEFILADRITPRPEGHLEARRPIASSSIAGARFAGGARDSALLDASVYLMGGGVGGWSSFWMHDAKSNNMNSSAFSCPERSATSHPEGNAAPLPA